MKSISREDWKMLKEEAQDALNNIDIMNMNDDDYCMFGASVAILNHKVPMCENMEDIRLGILDDFSDILAHYNETRTEESRDEMRKMLKSQLGAIEKELVEMRHEVHDPEAEKLFIQFRDNLKTKL